ncbi:MAG: hypothetical protein NC405_07055 [Odoribacter sp.]|nr:hypothetical protein [Odoribacter sp.]
MKLQYKLGLIAMGGIMMSSCARHDIINDVAPVGQEVPAAYWTLNSTVVKAGEDFTFNGKYSVGPGYTADHSEVWYQIVRTEEASVTSKLGGTSLGYNHKSTITDTIRTYQSMASFPHSAAVWDGHEFILDGSVSVSRTLAPVKWADITTWDQENFDLYYPEGFAEGFLSTVLGYLTDEETSQNYYNALRSVYISYDFTNEQFVANGFPEVDLEQPEADKSDRWFSTTVASDDAIVGYYYYTVEGDKNIVHEISIEENETFTAEPTYPVYKSADWVFCRYDDNAGAIISSVRSEWLPRFRALLETIPFEDWIYDTANACYKVDFARSFTLNTQFRVYDTEGNEGRAYDVISINVN